VRLNLSKRGVSSVSVGRRGAWLNLSRKGTRESIGLPGTGLQYHTETRPYRASGGKALAVLLLLLIAVLLAAFLAVVALN
jgi:hypothetical protein